MTLDLTTVAALIGLALGCLNLVAAIRSMLSAGEKRLDERLGHVEAALDEQRSRIQTIEGEMKHLPTWESQHRIEINMEKISGRLDTLNESLKPIRENGALLNELLKAQVHK